MQKEEDSLNPAGGQTLIKIDILRERLSNQQDQIDRLLSRIEKLEGKKKQQPLDQNAWPSIQQEENNYKPAVHIEMDGKTMIEPPVRQQQPQQPIDYVRVKNVRKFQSDRPKLSDSMNTKVNSALEQQKLTKQENTNPNKKPTQEKYITADERRDKIEQMFARSAQYVGMAPFPKAAITRAIENMTKRGIFKPNETYDQRRQRTIKSLIKTWTRQNLKMEDEDWDNLDIKEIIPSAGEDSDVIFLKLASSDEVAKINSKARNLPKSNLREAARLIMYVDNRARKCYRAFQNIARMIRQESEGTQHTSIQAGKHDFLLRKREKDDTTPWGHIPPLRMENQLPPIEIGLYKSLYSNEDLEIDNKTKDSTPNDQEMDNIATDITKDENQINNKRNISERKKLKPHKRKKTLQKYFQPAGRNVLPAQLRIRFRE